MATLVLSVVGGIVGGPVGAAVGGLIGNAVDHAVLGPKGREGPRLADLAVQTSSYGTPIAKVFGTMRVAGSVIWATDLQEHRSTERSGKGQPSVTSYSYSASFAVALSSRAIVSVGRIWADGNLLRGEAGDWKVRTGFRLHLGDEDQAVDPLIAAHEGAQAPAHRGIAYCVFEDLQLADYGNRIPSLTFEVVADGGAVNVGEIARAIGGGTIASEPVSATLGGFSAYGDSARGVAELLARAAGGWFAPTATGVLLRAGTGAAVAIEDAGVGEGRRRERSVRALETVPKVLTLAHYDPARDYQTGSQQVRRPGAGVRSERVELPAVIEAGAARTLAAGMLARAECERVRRTVSLDVGAAGVAPGDRVTIAGEAGDWRVTEARLEGSATTLVLAPLAPGPLAQVSTPGRVVAAPDRIVGATRIEVFELPNLDDTLLTQPRVLVAAAGAGAAWRRAALLSSIDEGVSWTGVGATALPATLGSVVSPPGAGPTTLFDLRNTVEVELLHDEMSLASTDDAGLDAGRNLAMVGGELLQFGSATQLGATRWRLARLLRGRRGVAAAHAAGERFVLVEPACVVPLDLPASAIGRRVRVLASGVGDTSGPAEATAVVSGVSIAPPAPVRLRAARLGDGGARVTWVRRSRLGWSWRDGGDVPLGEEREAYRVTVTAAGSTRAVATTACEGMLSASEVAAGAWMSVRQLGTFAESAAAELTMGANG
jgi:hypothetical protein